MTDHDVLARAFARALYYQATGIQEDGYSERDAFLAAAILFKEGSIGAIKAKMEYYERGNTA